MHLSGLCCPGIPRRSIDMHAGKLDRRITLQRYTETRDEFNAPVQSWSDLATVAAAVEHIRDAERWTAQEVGAEATMRFQIRYWSDVATINAKDRLIYEGDTFDITAVKELGRHAGLEITAAKRGD